MKKLLYHFYCRLIQKILFIVSPFMPYKKQRLITGEGSILALPSILKEEGKQKICIISDKHIISLDIVKELLEKLHHEHLDFVVYDEVPPNPTVEAIEQAKEFYIQCAEKVIELTGSKSGLAFKELPSDDPVRRKPDITKAKENLGWEPSIKLEQGLVKTIDYFSALLK